MKRLLQNVIFCVGLLFFAGAHAARAADSIADVTKLGPQVGEDAPGFTLPDQHGRERSLTSLMGPKGLVLVFFRSADW